MEKATVAFHTLLRVETEEENDGNTWRTVKQRGYIS